ncbi:hypothetical protein D3C76_912800 [compost metagenome]
MFIDGCGAELDSGAIFGDGFGAGLVSAFASGLISGLVSGFGAGTTSATGCSFGPVYSFPPTCVFAEALEGM